MARQLNKLPEKTGSKITAKRFRKDYAARMEAAGADPGIINLHQGRGQTGVLYKNYVTDMDRAVKLRRAYVDRMFGE